MDFFKRIINEIKTGKADIERLKIKLSKETKLGRIPTNIEILMNAKKEDLNLLKKYLLTKKTRTISGVSPVAVMTKPFPCPHGKCIMCPGGIDSYFGNTPQSYTGKEPAAMRAKRANFDSYIQIFNRLQHYIMLGHNVDKIELIVMGGTFPATSKSYQEEFITYCFKAMNDFSELFFKDNELQIEKFKDFFELPKEVGNKATMERINQRLLAIKGKSTLEKEQKRNETAKVRCIGLTIETRPDYGLLKQGNEMLRLGATRIELGVQTVYNDVLKAINRGHTTEQTKQSIQELKDLGFKLNFHMMLGLPLTNKFRDIDAFRELFTNPDYKPDMLKIYPCMVSKGTVLYNLMKKRKYKPLTTNEAKEIIEKSLKYVKRYCRIMRMQRDIPPKYMEKGITTNLRQYVDEKRLKCQCIRCRELGRHDPDDEIIYNTIEYNANNGKEFFISADTKKQDAIVGFARMRYPSKSLRKEITDKTALIRELHVYGKATEIGEKGEQHKGVGKELLKLAENQAKRDGKAKIVVISGIGVREYYKRLGYKQEGVYMVKTI